MYCDDDNRQAVFLVVIIVNTAVTTYDSEGVLVCVRRDFLGDGDADVAAVGLALKHVNPGLAWKRWTSSRYMYIKVRKSNQSLTFVWTFPFFLQL